MRKYFFGVCFWVVTFMSCTKTPNPVNPATQLPFIDFDRGVYYKLDELRNFRTTINCGDTAYWEGNRLKMQAYAFSGDLDTVNASFVVYDTEIVTKGYSARIFYDKAVDRAAITRVLTANKDNYCNLRLTCFTPTGQIIVGGYCLKPIGYNLLKATDITF